MEYFTRTTIIQPHIKIRRERTLPMNGEVVVGVGHEVTPNLVIARTPLETHFAIIDASEILGVSGEELSDYMIVETGAIVDIGTLLAQKKHLARSRQVLATVEGVLFEIINGRVILQQTSEWLEKPAMVAGRVVRSLGDRGVVIETQGGLIQGIWGSRKEGFGPLQVVTRSATSVISKRQIKEELEGKIVAGGRIDDIEVLELAAEHEIAGMILGGMSAQLCMAVVDSPFPVILTDGIGKHTMTEPVFTLLKEAEDLETSLFADYDEARGQRPEIIIPRPATTTSEAVSASKPIRIGQQVRLLREPYVGQIGNVTKLYSLSQIIATGAKAHGVGVQLADGNVIFVPHANFDVII